MALHIGYSDAITMNQQLITDRVGAHPKSKPLLGSSELSVGDQVFIEG
jgi:hypothetical protein